MAGWCSAVGWNCTNSTSATATPARSAIATPSPVASTGLVVTENSWPAPPVARRTCSARTSVSAPVARRATARPGSGRLDEQVEREALLVHDGRRRAHRLDQGPLDLRAGGRAAGVHDAGDRLWPPSRASSSRPSLVAVEHGAQRDQLVHAAGPLVDEHADGVGVAQAGAGAERVREVQSVESGSAPPSTAATPPCAQRVVGLVQLGLGEHADAHAVVLGRARTAADSPATPLPSTNRSRSA